MLNFNISKLVYYVRAAPPLNFIFCRLKSRSLYVGVVEVVTRDFSRDALRDVANNGYESRSHAYV